MDDLDIHTQYSTAIANALVARATALDPGWTSLVIMFQDVGANLGWVSGLVRPGGMDTRWIDAAAEQDIAGGAVSWRRALRESGFKPWRNYFMFLQRGDGPDGPYHDVSGFFVYPNSPDAERWDLTRNPPGLVLHDGWMHATSQDEPPSGDAAR